MTRRLPPLNALRAFETAARHLSFTKAARELHVTPAAVSHQVKALETYLGVALFRRQNRTLLLTDAGQATVPGLREGFDRLAGAIEACRAHGPGRMLTVTAPPSLGAKWLVPRLERFRAAHPELDVRLDASTRLVDLAREDVDVALRYGLGEYPGLEVECLLGDEVFPVCSPRLLQGDRALRTPADLARHTLLHVDAPNLSGIWPDWKMWLATAATNGVDPERGPRFSDVSLAVQAAIEGQGVALAGQVFVDDDLAAGRLVRLFELSFPSSFRVYVVCAESKSKLPAVAAFREWVKSEARREVAPAA